MQKIVLTLLFFTATLLADSTLLVKKGWQLIGLTTQINDMTLFETKNVEQVWHFDAQSQKWQGYAPDPNVQKKITDLNLSQITQLKSWHGFWVKSKQEWPLVLQSAQIPILSENNITLEPGWNLISLPIDTVISPDIFEASTLWKYNDKKWEFFDKTQSEPDFAQIKHISNSDGIWVKAAEKTTIDVSAHSAKLHTFTDEAQMKAYIKDMALTNHRPYYGYYPLDTAIPITFDEVNGGASSSSSSSSAGSFESDDSLLAPAAGAVEDATGTNLQVEGVDESDILKHDSKTIFFVDKQQPQKVSITTFARILSGEKTALDEIVLEDTKYVETLYLVDNRLVVLSTLNGNVYDEYEKYIAEQAYHIPRFSVDTFDVSDISAISKVGSFEIDGSLHDSRVLNGDLILISSFYPSVEVEYPKIYVDIPLCKDLFNGVAIADGAMPEIDLYKRYASCYDLYQDRDKRYYRYDYDNPNIVSENLMPQFKNDNNETAFLLTPQHFYVPAKKDQKATITTVSKIEINAMDLVDSSSVLGYQDVVYASSKALYLVSSEYPYYYDFSRYKERSSLYKFGIDENLSFQSMGFVSGHALNQFSLSEHNDTLRIATTEGLSWQNDTTNSIYTMRDIDGILTQQGFLGSLGHEGERIYAVRFMGARGYVVTFRQTDPFYTIDLSDPSRPIKVGELSIEGYSSYLHPISEDLIMGIGRAQDNALKLELFDVSDFADPQSVDLYTFDNSGYYSSEAEHNHKALAFRERDKLFTMPFSGGNYNIGYRNYLGVFQVVERKFKIYDAIIDNFSGSTHASLNRGIIFDKEGVTYVAYLVNGLAAFRTLESLEKE